MASNRRETRYSFPSERALEILTIVRNLLGQEQVHEFPVTETIYFTLGPKGKYAFPGGLKIRIRRYIKVLTSSVKIDRSLFFLEIKEETPEGLNHKTRTCVDGVSATERLCKGDETNKLPKLIASAATQSLRYHWRLSGHERLTLDINMRLFGFKDNRLEAEYVCDFEEGKLEFKLEGTSGPQITLENEIVVATGCLEHDCNYLERRIRQCLEYWLNQKPD